MGDEEAEEHTELSSAAPAEDRSPTPRYENLALGVAEEASCGGRVGCFTGVEGSDNVVGHVVSARLEVAGHQLELPEAPHHCLRDQQTQGRDTVNTLLMAFFFWFIRQLLCFAYSRVLSDDRETQCDGLEWNALCRTAK